MVRRRASYSDEDVDALISVLRAAKKGDVDQSKLMSDVLDLLTATGAYAGDEYAAAFRDAVDCSIFRTVTGKDPESQADLEDSRAVLRPSRLAAVRATMYQRIADADDVRAAVVQAVERDSVIGPELRALLGRRARVQLGRGKFQTAADRIEALCAQDPKKIQAAAERLALDYSSRITAGHPRKQLQDTLLSGLADIYLRHTGSSAGQDEVPHAVRSYFIKFAHVALAPFFTATEVTHAALSSAWRRIKRHSATA